MINNVITQKKVMEFSHKRGVWTLKLPFQWYTKFQLNICYISSSLIQIIKFPDDIMKKCILRINILQFMYFVVNYFVPYDKWSGIHPCTGEHHMFCTHKQSPFSLYCSGEYDIYVDRFLSGPFSNVHNYLCYALCFQSCLD